MKKFLLILFSLAMIGCSDSGSAEKKAEEAAKAKAKQRQQAEKEGFQEEVDKVVEDITGITALKSGRKAEDKVRQINADYNRKMEQVLEETEE